VPSTLEDLKTAFAGESQANRKYLAFAKKAETEGFPQIAKLFRAAAEAETIHALAHLQNMGGVGSTSDNLQAAVAGETYEYTEMYPPMVDQAEKESHKGKGMLRNARDVEKIGPGEPGYLRLPRVWRHRVGHASCQVPRVRGAGLQVPEALGGHRPLADTLEPPIDGGAP
jgi:hypothetical protein